MKTPLEKPHPLAATQDRRSFLRDCARYPILGALAVLGGALALRPNTTDPTLSCLKQRVCGGCAAFAGCSLPQALATRKTQP